MDTRAVVLVWRTPCVALWRVVSPAGRLQHVEQWWLVQHAGTRLVPQWRVLALNLEASGQSRRLTGLLIGHTLSLSF